MRIFDWLNQITYNKKDWNDFSESEHKSFNIFMVNRFLSMNKEWVEIVNMLQQYTIGMRNKDVYMLYKNLIPREKKFLRYIKSKKDKKYDKELIEIMCKHFEVGSKEVKEYISLMTKDELKTTLKLYGKNDKEIKKLIK